MDIVLVGMIIFLIVVVGLIIKALWWDLLMS